ncbi:MAG: dephospho-CoA kinase [Methyloprofundus sp.]|nr:dephospho-CoA kinase [Methyloprofundus sp.]
MFKVGLTGGIGCGKSTVAELFRQHNTPIIDADEIAHALVTPNSPALEKIIKNFGENCLSKTGHLNRTKLREIIFNNPQKKSQLEGLMHPLIYAEIEQQVQGLTSTYCIIAIPLLLETNMQASVDHILVVDCSETEQIKRVQLRDQLDSQQINAIIHSQVSRNQRLTAADSIINNNIRDNSQLQQQVDHLHHQFLKESA